MNRFILTSLLLLSAINVVAAEGHADHHSAAQELTLALDVFNELGGELATAAAGRLRDERLLPAEVRLNAEAVAHVNPRFAAQITQVNANTGDQVKAGQVLARAENSDTLAAFELVSLIDGVVINRHVTLGEHLQPTDTAFVVADLTRLWLDIALYPKQVAQVKPGMAVHISTSFGPAPVEAEINYVAPVVDKATRTGLARVFLANPEGQWKPGMFVAARVALTDFVVPVRVPQTAVIELKGKSVVFIREQNHWRAQAVELGRRDHAYQEVMSGLVAGEQYAAAGGFLLKAQLQKDELESGHNH
ncbi:efflux RND transporter periplasmic adaptor subunit [Gilvimarinus polysaccharolyticus]|uniref:efflux RND transporter periplasmic adaptor subunit n=1 Tax=Gilvimarinus polysaccharolyticus TaxID=863921 RepID=UPI0006738879|nr:efflux RND transporter periplasmic adaptor subunit [Gilvimarinus polysaccharolyticus]